jgi:predicted small lipoprotein YifL
MTRALCLAAVAGVLCALLAACGHVGPLEPPGGKGAPSERNGGGSGNGAGY